MHISELNIQHYLQSWKKMIKFPFIAPVKRGISADGILKQISYFSQKTEFDISCKMSPMENWKEYIINLSSAGFSPESTVG